MTALEAEPLQEANPKKSTTPKTVRYRFDPGTLKQVAESQVNLLCELLYGITPLALEKWEESRKAWQDAKDPATKEAHGLILRAQVESLERTFGSIFRAFDKEMIKAMALADKDDEGGKPGPVEGGTDPQPNGMTRGWQNRSGRSR